MARKTAGYGWIPDLPDQRDHLYAAPAPTLATLPSQADLRQQCPPVYDQGQLGSCFPAGSLVQMADGAYRPIEQVRLLDRVVTAEGRTGRVMQTMVRIEMEAIYRLKLWGHCGFEATAEHPVLTRRGYVPVSELRTDDFVGLPRYSPAGIVDEIRTEEHIGAIPRTLRRNARVSYAGVQGRVGLSTVATAMPATISLGPGFGRIIGLFLAEGSTDASKARWDFSADEETTLVSELVHLLDEELGVKAHCRRRGSGCWQVTVYGRAWARLFKSLCGTGAGYKRLHPLFAAGSQEFRRAVLDGWVAGDGWSKQGGTAAVTISHALALDMYAIAQTEGMRPGLQYGRPILNSAVKSRQPRWTVTMESNSDNWRSTLADSHMWRRVRAVEQANFIGPVYNLSVEGDQSYVVEGIGVHNCTANAIAAAVEFDRMKQQLSDFTPSRLFIYYNERVIEGTVQSDSGAQIRDGIKSVATQGVCPESDWAYDIAKFTQRPPDAAYQDATLDRAVSYQRLVQDLNQMKGCLASGYPFVFGFTVYESFESPQVAQTGHAALPGPTEAQIGGHAVMAVGYDDAQSWFMVRNSWGSAWGISGYFTLPYAYLSQHSLSSDFWTVRLVG